MVWKRNAFVHTAGPNIALVKSSGKRGVLVEIGRRLLAWPIFQRVDRLGLELRTVTVHTKQGTTNNGVCVDVTSCCQVKIQGWSSIPKDSKPSPHHISVDGDLHMDSTAIRLAAQHFIGMKDGQIEDAIKKTVAGHQRAIIGVLTVEQLYRDRNEFSRRVLDLCYNDMRNMGLTIVSYTVAEITDENGYIEALGVRQTELVKREATEGAALHQGQALARKAQEEAGAHLEVNRQIEREVESDKLRAIRQAEAQQRIDRHVAIQQKAHAISTAEQDAVLLVQRKKAYAAEAEAELLVMRQKVEREKLLKEQMIHVEADARLYKAKIEAEGIRATAAADGDRIKMLAEAEAIAQAEMIRGTGVAEAETAAEKIKQHGHARADVILAHGVAETDVAMASVESIRAKGKAELETLRDRLHVWKTRYVDRVKVEEVGLCDAIMVTNCVRVCCLCSDRGNVGAIVEQMVSVLPEVAAAVAEPLAKTEKMMFVESTHE